jgi:hypothetical protein
MGIAVFISCFFAPLKLTGLDLPVFFMVAIFYGWIVLGVP